MNLAKKIKEVGMVTYGGQKNAFIVFPKAVIPGTAPKILFAGMFTRKGTTEKAATAEKS